MGVLKNSVSFIISGYSFSSIVYFFERETQEMRCLRTPAHKKRLKLSTIKYLQPSTITNYVRCYYFITVCKPRNYKLNFNIELKVKRVRYKREVRLYFVQFLKIKKLKNKKYCSKSAKNSTIKQITTFFLLLKNIINCN